MVNEYKTQEVGNLDVTFFASLLFVGDANVIWTFSSEKNAPSQFHEKKTIIPPCEFLECLERGY